MACSAPIVAAQTATAPTGRAIGWGAAASAPLASHSPTLSAIPATPPALAPVTPQAAMPATSPSVVPLRPASPTPPLPLPQGAASLSAGSSAKLARPDAAAMAKAPVKLVHVPASRARPPAGAALAATNAQTLAEAHAMPARTAGLPQPRYPVPQAEKIALPGAGDSVKIAAPGLAPAAVTCIPGNASAPKGAITPGGRVSMRGCDLGSRRGEMRMLGQFPGGMVKLTVEEWAPDLVIAMVPAELRGVVDQDIRMQLVPAAGTPSKEQPGFFQARRETVELPDALVSNVECAHPQPSECWQQSLLGARWAAGSHRGGDAQHGRDSWRLSVGRAWELDHIETRLTGGAATPTSLAPQGDQQIVHVDWGSLGDGTGMFYATYMLRFFVSGPAGVPFTAGIN